MATGQLRRHVLIIAVAFVMAGVLWGLTFPLAPMLAPGSGLLVQGLALAALIGTGLVVYFGLVHITGIQKLNVLLTRLRRRA
jgi:putative peptidoglycan lipid II flippase